MIALIALLIALLAPPEPLPLPVLLLGDSISQGEGASDRAHAYAALLEHQTGREVVTAAGSGRNLRGVARQWATRRQAYPVVIVQVGGNDASRWREGWIDNAAEWEAVYRLLITDMRASGVGRVIVVTPGPGGNARVEGYAAAARRLSDVATVVDTWPTMRPAHYVDGVHPNDAGHAELARLIGGALRTRVWLPLMR